MRKVLLPILITLMLFFLVGCQISNKAYEGKMKEILERAQKRIEENLAKSGGKEQKDRDKEIILVLKEIKAEIEEINPPNEFFAGHSDLIEFLDLFIDMREKGPVTQGGKGKGLAEEKEGLKYFQGAMSALSRASKELPFLEYEMRQAFEKLTTTVIEEQRKVPFSRPNQGPPRSLPGQKNP